MATRSFISRINLDGSVTAIYCHFDGYPSGVGAALTSPWWSTSAAVSALLELGDISTLGRCIETTTAYHRDRGEELNIRQFESTAALLEAARAAGVEYVYTWSEGRWQTTKV